MINTFTLGRARDRVAEIAARGLATDVTTVELGAYVGGTESRPEMWHGHAVSYVQGGETRFTVWPLDIRDALKATYVIDGQGYYVAGWQGHGEGSPDVAIDGWVLLHPIRRITHVTTGAVSDFMLRPSRRAYIMWSTPIAA